MKTWIVLEQRYAGPGGDAWQVIASRETREEAMETAEQMCHESEHPLRVAKIVATLEPPGEPTVTITVLED